MKYLLATLFLFVPGILCAQVTDSLDLDEIVVTASKVETTERQTTKPVTVITSAELEQSPVSDLSQLLQQQSGLLINGAFSNPGKDKAVYLRGAGTQYTVILIDGYPVSDPSSEGGAFDPRLLPLSSIERIEIVKGSMSTLYGSDAIAGVINIITKKSTDNSVNVNGSASYGAFNSQNYTLGVNGKLSGYGYCIDLSRKDIDGISEAEAPAAGADFDKDGFVRNSVSTRFELPLFEGFTLEPILTYSDYDGDYDNGAFSDGDNRYEATFLNTGTRFEYNHGRYDLKGAVTYTDTERKFTDGFGVFNPTAQLLNSDVYGVYNLDSGTRLLAGVNHQKLDYQLDATETGTSIISPYVTAFIVTESGLDAELGLRFNQHSDFGSNITFNIAPVFNLNRELKLMASLSSGFKSPTLNEMFGPFGANPDLDPQRSLTFDIGGRLLLVDGQLTLEGTYFRRKIEDLILYSGISGNYENVNEQDDHGVEFSINLRVNNSVVSGFYNYLDGVLKTNSGEQENLIRRPKHSLGLNLAQSITPDWSVNLGSQFVGKRDDLYFDMNTFIQEEVELDSYVLLNIGTSYRFKGLTIFGEINNALDSDYTEVYGFSTPGIHGTVGVKFNFMSNF
jgi:vitamin B12 transporter